MGPEPGNLRGPRRTFEAWTRATWALTRRTFTQPNDFIALAMGRVAAQRLTPGTISVFKASIERKRHQIGDGKYYRMWDLIVAGGVDAIRQALVEPSERGQVLRSVISFRAFLTQQERDDIFRRHTRNAAAGRVR